MQIQNDLLNIRCPNLIKFRLPKSAEVARFDQLKKQILEHGAFKLIQKEDDC